MQEPTNDPGTAPETRRYADRVASAVAAALAKRDPLTVDELDAVAAAIRCRASDLLPSHIEDRPTPAACPRWCRAEHDPSGWDEVETQDGELVSVSKHCQQSLELLPINSGFVEVVLDRLAAADLTGRAWGDVYVCDAYVRLLDGGEPIMMTLEETQALARHLRSAGDEVLA